MMMMELCGQSCREKTGKRGRKGEREGRRNYRRRKKIKRKETENGKSTIRQGEREYEE